MKFITNNSFIYIIRANLATTLNLGKHHNSQATPLEGPFGIHLLTHTRPSMISYLWATKLGLRKLKHKCLSHRLPCQGCLRKVPNPSPSNRPNQIINPQFTFSEHISCGPHTKKKTNWRILTLWSRRTLGIRIESALGNNVWYLGLTNMQPV